MNDRLMKALKKVSLVDILLSVFFLFSVFAVLFFFARKNQMVEITVKVSRPSVWNIDANTMNEYAESFVVGDVEKNELGQETARIKKVSSNPVDLTKQSVYLVLEVAGNFNPRKNQYSIKGKPIAFGQELLFTFSNVKFDAVVVDFPGYKNDRLKKTINVEAQLRDDNRYYSEVSGVPDFIAQAVKKDQQIIDSNGNGIVVVKNVKITPAKRQIINNASQLIIVNDVSLKDVVYELELSVYEYNGRYYIFDHIPVLVGQKLPLNFSNASISPTITKIILE